MMWFAEAAVSGALISEGVQVVMMIDTRWLSAEGMISASPAYFPCEARYQSQSYRLSVCVAICWHVARLAGGTHVVWVELYWF